MRIIVASIVVAASSGGCGDFGCATQPLPGGALPADQTVEGGGQIRVTPSGFQKLTSLLPAAVNEIVAGGFCVPQGEWGEPDGGFPNTGTYYCNTNRVGQPPTAAPDSCGSGIGCDVDLHLDFLNLSVPDESRLDVAIQLDVYSVAHLDYQVFGVEDDCDMIVSGQNIYVNADIVFGIKPEDGELDVHLNDITDYDLSGVEFSNCGFISSAGNFAVDFINSWFGGWIVDALEPTIDDLIRGMLPDPLGIEGLVDVGELAQGVSPGTSALMEARIVPGGYVGLRGGGMSLGLVTGLNADEDIATRDPSLDSEPHLCVPPIPPPNFAAPPASLPITTRGTFTLPAAGVLDGLPADVAGADLAIGLSETTLDLMGHHAVTSGALCLGVGTTVIDQLTIGTFSLLVQSLGNLGEPDDPVLLVTRPTRAIDVSIGDNTPTSPALTLAISNFEVDVYVFAYERYTRAFAMSLDLNVGVNLVFEQVSGMSATVRPELVGLDAGNIHVDVIAAELVTEPADQLASVLPTVFDLAVGVLGDSLAPIEIPEFAGFTLNDLALQHIATSQDDFLAISAVLGSSAAMRESAKTSRAMAGIVAHLDRSSTREAPVMLAGAEVASVVTPPPDEVRAALAGEPGARLPAVTITVPTSDFGSGRPLEHAWRLAGGPWRPYRSGHELVIADRAFAWQGKYTIDVRSRIAGDYTTTSEPVAFPVIIDSVAPEIVTKGTRLDDDGLIVKARDIVSDRSDLSYAWGHVDDAVPATGWSSSSALDRTTYDDLAVDGVVAVFVRDEAGNVAIARVPFHGQAGSGGCNCGVASGSSPAPGSALLSVVVAVGLRRRSRKT